MIRRAIAVVATVAVMVLGACSDPPPAAGYVRDRDHRNAYDTTWVQQVCVAYGKNGGCTMYVPIEQTDHHPERWRLFLEECTTSSDDQPSCSKGWREVDSETWAAYPVGSHYPDAR